MCATPPPAAFGSPCGTTRVAHAPSDVFARVLREAGVEPPADGAPAMLSVGVDARVARRSVQSALCLNSALAKRFVAGLAECLDESEETLRAALRPLRRSGGHATGGSRRDSLCRVLLSAVG